MAYVDGFVLAVPTAQKEAYREFSERFASLFQKHGALSLAECWGEDVPDGELTSFPMAVKCDDDETVVFSWIVWPDKATRDTGNKAVMADMEADGVNMQDVPFDGKRMIFGGFDMIVSAEQALAA